MIHHRIINIFLKVICMEIANAEYLQITLKMSLGSFLCLPSFPKI